MRMQPCWGQQCERISVVSTTWERKTECAAEQSKIQVVERCKIPAVGSFAIANFLTSIIPLDILRGSCRAQFVPIGNAGGVAQLGERLNGIQEVRGSIPLTSMAGVATGTDVCSRE